MPLVVVRDFVEVFLGHILFIGPASLFDLLPDFLRVRIEDGHHFRLGDLRVHQLEHGLKQAEFFSG